MAASVDAAVAAGRAAIAAFEQFRTQFNVSLAQRLTHAADKESDGVVSKQRVQIYQSAIDELRVHVAALNTAIRKIYALRRESSAAKQDHHLTGVLRDLESSVKAGDDLLKSTKGKLEATEHQLLLQTPASPSAAARRAAAKNEREALAWVRDVLAADMLPVHFRDVTKREQTVRNVRTLVQDEQARWKQQQGRLQRSGQGQNDLVQYGERRDHASRMAGIMQRYVDALIAIAQEKESADMDVMWREFETSARFNLQKVKHGSRAWDAVNKVLMDIQKHARMQQDQARLVSTEALLKEIDKLNWWRGKVREYDDKYATLVKRTRRMAPTVTRARFCATCRGDCNDGELA